MKKWTNWTGNKNKDWNDPENWTNGVPSEATHALIPSIPIGGNFPKILTSLSICFTLKNNGILENEGLLTIEKEGIIQNDGKFINRPSATILNRGIVMNKGKFENAGKLNNEKIFTDHQEFEHILPEEFMKTMTEKYHLKEFEVVLS